MINPKITVITVCYNSAASLEAALVSVLNQDWPRVEHIVIDGGSVDGTLAVLNKYKSHLTHVVSEPDEGIYDAMNKGLDLATGDIICFLNSDDRYASNHVLSLVAMKMEKYQLDALLGDVAYFHPQDSMRMVRYYRSGWFEPNRLGWGWMPAHPAVFLHKSVVRRVGQFNKNYKIAGDFDYVARAFHGYDLRYMHIAELMVHMQTGGISTAGWRSKLLLNLEVLRSCRENGISTNIFKILSKYPMKLTELIWR